MVRLTDRPDMTLDVYCGRKTTTQQQHPYRFTRHCVVLLYTVYNDLSETLLFKSVPAHIDNRKIAQGKQLNIG